MTIMPKIEENDNAISKCCDTFIKRFDIKQLLRTVNATKEKGIPAYEIFAFLMGLVFSQKNLYTLLEICNLKLAFGKDTVYRFLNNTSVNWENFIAKLSFSVISKISKLTSDDRRCVLIIDDTSYYRDRSKKVEFLSRCYDHVAKKFYKGLTLLTLGWSDGQTFLPVMFHLLASGNDKNLLNGSHVKTDNRTLATKRRTDARKEKPSLALLMLKAVKTMALQAKYVLFDSWFASPSFILSVNLLGYHVVARLKNFENYRFVYQDKNLSISQIFRKNKKRRGLSRYLLSVTIKVQHHDFAQMIPAKLVYVRDKANRGKWIALISTDVTLSEDEIIALYGKRWDIETYHKMMKSYLRLAKEFQTRSFDAMTAHTAIVLTFYLWKTGNLKMNAHLAHFFMMCAKNLMIFPLNTLLG
jgi:hypothetical protein